MGTVRLLETDLQTQITNYLRLLENHKKLFYYRITNGPKIHSVRGKVIYTKNPCPGLPDLIVDPIDMDEIWVEIKTTTGKQSEHQKKVQKQRELAGKVYVIWRSLEDCIWHLESLGIKA